MDLLTISALVLVSVEQAEIKKQKHYTRQKTLNKLLVLIELICSCFLNIRKM
jgi:hypothetical protein